MPDAERGMEGRLLTDFRSLCGISPAEMQAARERYMLAGLDLGVFADEAARHARRHGNLADFPAGE